jgi:hypothetical protein
MDPNPWHIVFFLEMQMATFKMFWVLEALESHGLGDGTFWMTF